MSGTSAAPQAPAAGARPARAGLYFVGPAVDFLFMGGLSILLYFLLPPLLGPSRTPGVIGAAAALAWAVNWPHFSATLTRLYRSPGAASRYPVTALVVPPLMAAAAAGSLLSPNVMAPMWVKLFLIWSPYHFSGQTVGLTLVYARRAGYEMSSAQRWFLSAWVFGTFLLNVARAEAGSAGTSYHAIAVPSLGIPGEIATLVYVGLWASGVGLAAATAAQWLVKRQAPPWIVALPAVAQFFWFAAGSSVPGYYEFVPLFHSLQYLLVAWAVQLKERLAETGAEPSPWFASRESAKWAGLNFAGGVLLFYALPRAAAGLGYPLTYAEPIMISAVQIHHFLVDGIIWKLRRPDVAAPLMARAAEFWRPRGAAA